MSQGLFLFEQERQGRRRAFLTALVPTTLTRSTAILRKTSRIGKPVPKGGEKLLEDRPSKVL